MQKEPHGEVPEQGFNGKLKTESGKLIGFLERLEKLGSLASVDFALIKLPKFFNFPKFSLASPKNF